MKRQLTLLICIAAALIFALSSCKDDVPSALGSTGKTNEIIIVASNRIGMNHPVVDTLKEYFMQYDTQLPQLESLYDVIVVTDKEFNSQSTIHRHHNLLIVNYDPSLEKSGVTSRKNVWAQPQRVIQFNLNSDADFQKLFDTHKSSILQLFDENELIRAQDITEFGKSIGLADEVYKQFDIIMNIPAGFSVAKKSSDFIWFKQTRHNEKQDMIASIMIWKRPYTTELQFSTDSIINSRNDVAKKYVEGSVPHSYMKTATSYIYPQTEVISNYVTDFAIETRGLWEMQGDFMGGAFISYTFAHPYTGQLIAIEAFLYNPNNPKRPLLRQLESIIRNIKFPDKPATT
ncbi:MAG: DUF4837 family protein [Bacteroidales bacterium]|jgi:hypothetical protein|nr:DUF4837 family protein [Bacteroidales bacterium]